MTGRSRLLTALACRCPDRVPISTYELVGCNSRSFENLDPSYKRLMDAVRQRTDCVCMWDPSSNSALAKTDHVGDFLETTSHPVEIDIQTSVKGSMTETRKTIHTARGDLTSTTKVFDNVHTVWKIEHWCKSPDDVEAILSIPYEPVDYDFSDYSRIELEVGENGIVMSTVFDALGWMQDLMGFPDCLVWSVTDPDAFSKTLCVIHERCMENLKRMLDAGTVDLYRLCGAEVATPPYMGRESFERFVVPFDREMVELIHGRGRRARLHCHGKIGSVLDLIGSVGADALDPCEEPPDGDIALSDIKEQVGERLCLFGSIQLKLLEYGTSEEIRSQVRNCMDAAKRNGGYVIMPTAAPINTPLDQKTEENYLHYMDAAIESGTYQ